MIYLSKVVLNLRNRRVQKELVNIYELHRTLLSAFPDRIAGGLGRVLFRVERFDGDTVDVLVQSESRPDWQKFNDDPSYLVGLPATKELEPSFREGQRLLFRLRANPTVKREGKRLGHYRMEDQIAWFNRKAGSHGFTVEHVLVAPERAIEGKKGPAAMKFSSALFEGVIRVTDPVKFREAIETGIGSAKGFGFGLLSVAPAKV